MIYAVLQKSPEVKHKLDSDYVYSEETGPEGEMTKEDVPESSGGDSVLGPHRSLSPDADRPVVHQVASAPMPSDCEFSFFDPSDPQCREVLLDPGTSVAELFAVLRQWVPQVQKNISLIGNEILKRGCGVNDRDGLTDMSLLHYTCKAGAPGIGDTDTAASFARQLLCLGALPGLRSRWTNMNALHYAAYFDVPPLIRVVLQASQPGEVDATCSDFDFGTSLHIAASNLCLSAAKCLLELGANPAFRNERGQCPVDVVPEPLEMPLEMADAAALAKEMRALLKDALPQPCAPILSRPTGVLSDKAKAQLRTMGIQIGDRVVIAGQKVGTLRFCGSTDFAGGQWAGVELVDPEGKNDGSVAGVQYFSCLPKHGIFAPLSKITKPSERRRNAPLRSSTPLRSTRLDLSHVTSKVNTDSPSSSSSLLTERCEVEPLQSVEVTMLHRTGRKPYPLWGMVPESRQPTAQAVGPEARSSGGLELRPGPAAPPHHLCPAIQGTADRYLRSSVTEPRPPFSALGLGVQTRPCVSAPPAATATAPRPDTPREGHAQFKATPQTAQTAAGPRTRTPSASSSVCEGSEVRLGERVLVVGQRTGVVRFYGKTSFAPGFWLGYFSCPPKHGVFAPPSRVQRIHGSLDCLSELTSSRLNRSFTGIRRSFSTSSAISPQRDQSRKSPVSRTRPASLRRRWSTVGGGAGPSAGGRGSPAPAGPERAVSLHLGMQVLLTSANEMGCIRYLGPADFAPGLWLGLDLRAPRGKNDGAVGGQRYFTCRPGHGVLVRPSRVTYRGINGGRLVDELS
ncbi:hypothetical protein COCON_G00018310 [Conger conger]|uniref:CAP-Gly domain-containing protein n=1 Tax=Conger conger TaxID=82655 RepID=A0A9Q1E3Y2_CONCO|nr:hypothetical protein COCON_G00018310 [Conger conger]